MCNKALKCNTVALGYLAPGSNEITTLICDRACLSEGSQHRCTRVCVCVRMSERERKTNMLRAQMAFSS